MDLLKGWEAARRRILLEFAEQYDKGLDLDPEEWADERARLVRNLLMVHPLEAQAGFEDLRKRVTHKKVRWRLDRLEDLWKLELPNRSAVLGTSG